MDAHEDLTGGSLDPTIKIAVIVERSLGDLRTLLQLRCGDYGNDVFSYSWILNVFSTVDRNRRRLEFKGKGKGNGKGKGKGKSQKQGHK